MGVFGRLLDGTTYIPKAKPVWSDLASLPRGVRTDTPPEHFRIPPTSLPRDITDNFLSC